MSATHLLQNTHLWHKQDHQPATTCILHCCGLLQCAAACVALRFSIRVRSSVSVTCIPCCSELLQCTATCAAVRCRIHARSSAPATYIPRVSLMSVSWPTDVFGASNQVCQVICERDESVAEDLKTKPPSIHAFRQQIQAHAPDSAPSQHAVYQYTYTCAYTNIYIHIHVYIHTYIYIYIHIYKYIYMYICTYIYIYAYIYIFIYLCVRI